MAKVTLNSILRNKQLDKKKTHWNEYKKIIE